MRGGTLDTEIDEVVDSGRCTGCGACCQLDPGLAMGLDAHGYARPTRTGDAPPTGSVERFRAVCPGVEVRARHAPGARRHPTMGSWLGAWEAWAADPELRHRGSSGGALTALVAWMSETGEAHRTVGAGADATSPARTVTVQITSRAEAVASAGSRYAPVANAAATGATGADAFVGKPCEAAAMRRLTETSEEVDAHGPLLLSFFCAGTPSQHATARLVTDLGLDADEPLRDLWYRGRGWPGSFTVEAADGRRVRTSYDESWGRVLGPSMQWRCKICPDGVGESSDVTAADFWVADEQGYPVFTEGEGSSALVARTARGLDLVGRALAAGVIVGRPVDLDDLARVQPFQVRRRSTLLGRLLGARLGGRRGPRYRGFGLVRLALARPVETLRTARGSRSRVVAERRRRSEPTGR